MAATKRIKRALVSVYHKDGLDEILKKLHREGVSFVSTGGTQKFIEELGLPCDAVEDLTGYPSILGGRVKTLHPKVFGGILNRRDNEGDQAQIAQYEIPEIDLVIVDLYPFEETVASGAEEQAIIEKIDIGGISLIRAAAKNFKDVVIVASKAQYQPLMQLLNEKGAETSIEDRNGLPKKRLPFLQAMILQSSIISTTAKARISVLPWMIRCTCATVKTRTRLPSSMANSIICLTSCMVRKSLTTTCSTLTLL